MIDPHRPPEPRVCPGAVAGIGPTSLIALVFLTAACSQRPADEEIIHAHLTEMSRALVERDSRAFMNPVAEDFTGITWNLDRQSLLQLLRREMLVRDRLRAQLIDVRVDMRGEDRAVAGFHAVLIGGSGWIPDEGRWFRVETGWRREGRDWKLISAEWEQIAGHARAHN